MRKLFKSLALVAVAAMTLSACQKEVEPQQKNEEGLYKYTFSIIEDKAVIGDSNIEWVAGDRVGMFVGDYKGYAKIDVTTTPKTVVIYSNDPIPAGTKAYAYAPYDEANKTNSAEITKIVINGVQNGASISSMPLAGIPFKVENEIAAEAQEGNGAIKFLNLGSVINFKVFSSDEEFQNETIQSIKFEAIKTIAGAAYLDLTSVDMDNEDSLELQFLDEEDELNSVRVDQVLQVVADKEDATPIKMVIVPGLHEGIITVTTDVATYTKEMPAKQFDRSGSRTFGLDLAKCEREEGVQETVMSLPYEESFASNIGDFTTDGEQVANSLIWQYASGYGMKATARVSSTNYEAESWLISPWIDLNDVVSAAVSFDHVHQYAASPASNQLTLWVLTDEDDADWVQVTIPTYAAGNNWTFVNSGDVMLNDFIGNNVKVGFKYTSTESKCPTWEVKNFSAHIVKADPELSYVMQTWDIDLGDESAEAQVLTNPHELTVTYSSSNTAVVEVDENTGDLTAVKAVGSSIIVATFEGNDSYKAGTARYTIQVSDPSVTYSEFAWDLSKDETVSKSTEEMVWNYRGVTMVSARVGENTAVNNYCPPSQSSTRFYKNNTLTITPYTGSTIGYVEFTATTTGYATALASSAWTNATASANGTLVTVNPTDGTVAFSATIGATTGVTEVKVYYLGELATVVTYAISVDDDVENGSISASAEEAEAGTTVTLTATADEGYHFVSWTVTDDDDNAVTVTGNQFVMPESDVYVTATFEENQGDILVYTLTPASGSNNAYASACDITIDGITWNLTGNSQYQPWRIGGKSLTGVDRALYSKTALNYNISKIDITHGSASLTVNSMTVIVASDADFSNVVSTLNPTFEANATVTVERPSGADWSNCYYKIIYNVTVAGTSNKFLEFSKAEFTGQ